ncbi:unnamed protein product, partial [Discosporangium mesarthrocarpum]
LVHAAICGPPWSHLRLPMMRSSEVAERGGVKRPREETFGDVEGEYGSGTGTPCAMYRQMSKPRHYSSALDNSRSLPGHLDRSLGITEVVEMEAGEVTSRRREVDMSGAGAAGTDEDDLVGEVSEAVASTVVQDVLGLEVALGSPVPRQGSAGCGSTDGRSEVWRPRVSKEEGPAVDELVVKKCEVCKAQDRKYCCPRCQRLTCSLSCCLLHKKQEGCDGKRNRTEYVSMSDFTDTHLRSDFNFLEDALRRVEVGRREMKISFGGEGVSGSGKFGKGKGWGRGRG